MSSVELSLSEPSICIPRVGISVTEEYIRSIINNVIQGTISYQKDIIKAVDLISRQNDKGEDYQRVFIHIDNWESIDSSRTREIRKKLNDGETIKIMHNPPSYWKCSASRFGRPSWLQ